MNTDLRRKCFIQNSGFGGPAAQPAGSQVVKENLYKTASNDFFLVLVRTKMYSQIENKFPNNIWRWPNSFDEY